MILSTKNWTLYGSCCLRRHWTSNVKTVRHFLISNFRRVLNVVCFLLNFRRRGITQKKTYNSQTLTYFCSSLKCSLMHESKVDSSWNVMAHGDAREGKWRGNWRMEWVASTLHTTSECGVSSITTADAHTSATSSRLNWRPRRFKWSRPFRRNTKYGFCTCAITFQLASNTILSRVVHRRCGAQGEVATWGAAFLYK
jgi:hypothetical protein